MPRKKKIYIAGKVTGLPRQETMTKFRTAENQLAQEYWQVINPTLLINEDEDWDSAMKTCLEAVADCDAIYMLSDWQDSRGATLEHTKAKELNLQVLYQSVDKGYPTNASLQNKYNEWKKEN